MTIRIRCNFIDIKYCQVIMSWGTLQGPLVSKERAFKDQVDGVTGCGEFPTMSWNPYPMSRWLSKRRVGEWGAFCRGSTEAH